MLEDFDLGAMLLFETSNIRYATATQIGYWAFNKGERWALVTREGRPKVWDFGSAAKAHRLQLPHMYDHQNSVGGNTGTPKDRVKTLQKAFADTLKDKAFVAEAEKSKLEIDPLTGDEVHKTVGEMFDVDEGLKTKLKAILTSK